MAVTGERFALDARVELITPPEAARLAGPAGNSSGDDAPIPGAKLADQPSQHLVLSRRPRSPHFPTGDRSAVGTVIAECR